MTLVPMNYRGTGRKDPLDIAMGARIRQARTAAGISQERLGALLGITFQQVQKYEKGTNRVGPSRLVTIAKACRKTVAWFFEGLEDAAAKPTAEPAPTLAQAAMIRRICALTDAKRRVIAQTLDVLEAA